MDKSFIITWSRFILSRFACVSSDVAEFIACQFALESNYGRSDLALMDCNISGMKKPFYRVTTANINSAFKFAHYDDEESCVLDYFFWLQMNRFNQHTLSHLDAFIIELRNSGYCPEKGYVDKIINIYKQFKSLNYEK